jgi:3-isopropylmalate/(R)-2-methylmalate dehydratase large subunit
MECGCKLSIFEADTTTREYLHSVDRAPMLEVYAGKKATYKEEFEIDLEKLEPQVAEPGNVDKVKTVTEIEGQPIDQAFIGSSTNGRYEDLAVAASILKDHKVKDGTRCIITPASRAIFEQAISGGLAEIFLRSGAVFTNATCGACVGTHLGALGENEICISSSPRNYVGRMGATSAKIYLASPATCAASALEGKITDPREYL